MKFLTILLTLISFVEMLEPDRSINLTTNNKSNSRKERKRAKKCHENRDSRRKSRKCGGSGDNQPDNILIKSPSRAIEITEQKLLKGSWCKAQPLRVEVSHPGCKTRKITNKYCYGQCNSFFIPNTNEDNPVFASCAYCKPHKTVLKYVTLKCSGPGSTRKKIEKKVEIIEECRCVAIPDLNLVFHTDL